MLLYLLSRTVFALSIGTRGYIETRFSYADFSEAPWQSTERYRSDTKIRMGDGLSIQVTPQLSWTQGRYEFGEYLRAIEEPLQEELGIGLDQISEECEWDLETERNTPSFSDLFSVPRLFLDIRTEYFDLRLGKQALNWGAGQFFNPTNIVAENLLTTPWQERAGLYAMKTIIPISNEQNLNLLVSTEEFHTKDIYGTAIYQTNLRQNDLSVVASSDIENTMLGINLKGDATVGYWMEAAYTFKEKTNMLALTTGVDYSIPLRDGLLVLAQLSYDSSGEIEPKYYDWRARQPEDFFLPYCSKYPSLYQAPPEDSRQTLGRLYALYSAQIRWNELWTLQFHSLHNLNDDTGLLYPNIHRIIQENWQIHLGLQVVHGEDGEFAPNTDHLALATDSQIPRWMSISWLRYSF